jgi:4-aminobutyrate aminotransferase
MERGSGSFVWTATGERLLDFTSGIGVTNTGHCHPKVVEAAQKQCATLIHGQVNLAYHQPMLDLTTDLIQSMPHASLDRIFYSTTGAEAVENAVKLAKYTTGRPNIICFQGGYHGRTQLTMSMTSSSVIYRQRMVTPSSVFISPFPYELHGHSVEYCLKQLKLLFQQQVLPEEIAAIIIEPVLGEGGYVPAPVEFMNALRQICNEHGILLVIDEVQTGFGRTGKLFASEHYPDAPPDILVMAKGLASGFPLSAVAASHTLTDQQDPGTMGGTYAGNAISCAAALATQRVIREEGLVKHAQEIGQHLKTGLDEMQTRYPIMRDVRGLGCMIGVEFQKDVAPGTNKALSQACFRNGMMLLPASVYPTVRFIPPLTVSEEEVNMGLDIFEKSLQEIQ